MTFGPEVKDEQNAYGSNQNGEEQFLGSKHHSFEHYLKVDGKTLPS
jgi:hypothetical protein